MSAAASLLFAAAGLFAALQIRHDIKASKAARERIRGRMARIKRAEVRWKITELKRES